MNRTHIFSDDWVLTASSSVAPDNQLVSPETVVPVPTAPVADQPGKRSSNPPVNLPGNPSSSLPGNRSINPPDAGPICVPFSVPGDVHSSLLARGLIDEPYYRDNEYVVDWVNRSPWSIQRSFTISEHEPEEPAVLVLEGIDCVATVFLNDQRVGSTDNQFVRYVFLVSNELVAGENTLRIDFAVALDVAAERKQQHPFELPGESPNCRLPNNNFLRKTACHSGWDWNICLMPIGVYGSVSLERPGVSRVDDVRLNQHFSGNDVTVNVDVQLTVFRSARVMFNAQLCGVKASTEVELYPGQQRISLELALSEPVLWWPVGMGDQVLHLLEITVDDQRWTQNIGLCRSEIIRTPDSEGPGSGFRIDINGQPMFMRGANWIPADALPQRGTPTVVRELLTSAVDANMNMIRVWGGGQYEADWFYELCDELGVLVWHDFMFSCNHYPASVSSWINSVRTEAVQQVRRLSRFACIALWCGDNELVGALKWWEVTSANRDRYLANYVRLNTVLEEAVAAEAPETPWWPSSPSQGLLDYADGWKSDVAGDMHFWDVWHEAKPFSAYQEIHPRFCSEFGFQSFPSMPVVNTFARADDQNVSSRVMGVHQRNVGGNARIVETLVRYFAFPDSFERTVFLSQCQQAMAIRTGVEYWRSLKPHCMGTLYWQLNDTWPVASWSSLEYGGGWKLLHYAARRFFQPVALMVVPVQRSVRSQRAYSGIDPLDESPLCLRAVNDSQVTVNLTYQMSAVDMLGQVQSQWQGHCVVDPDTALDLLEFNVNDVPDDCFLSFRWIDENTQGHRGEGEYWTRAYKQFQLPVPTITVSVENGNETGQAADELNSTMEAATCITLTTDKPAFFVSVELGGKRVWSDNGFTLLPGQPKTLCVVRTLENPAVPEVEALSLSYL